MSVFCASFFNDPSAAFMNIARSLRPGGRLALLSWQAFEHNEWLTMIFDALAAGRRLPTPTTGAPGPFGLADYAAVHRILRDAGLDDAQMTSLREPMWIGRDAADAWTFVSEMGIVRGLTEDLDSQVRTAALARLHEAIQAHETRDGVLLGSAAWLITARRT